MPPQTSHWNRRVPAAIDSIVLPEKLPCRACTTTKNLTAFSAAQQLALKQRVRDSGARDTDSLPARDTWMVCLTCNRQQRDEFRCYGCDEWKTRQAFSKQQLKNPDEAQCWSCIQARLNEAPGADPDDSCSDCDSDDADEDPYRFSDDEGTIAGTFSGAPSTSAGPHSERSGGGVPVGIPWGPAPMASASMAGREADDADSVVDSEVSHATGWTASPAPSTTGMAGERRVWSETSGGGRFAKVKAGYRPTRFSYVEGDGARKQAAAEEARRKSEMGGFGRGGGGGAGAGAGRNEDDISVLESDDSDEEEEEEEEDDDDG